MVTDAEKIKPSLLPFIKMENVISDVLHMELRVTRFQLLLHNDLQSMGASFSNNMVNNSNFKKYIDFLESIGIKKPSRIENNKLALRNLSGKEQRQLTEKLNLCNLFPALNMESLHTFTFLEHICTNK